MRSSATGTQHEFYEFLRVQLCKSSIGIGGGLSHELGIIQSPVSARKRMQVLLTCFASCA